MRISGLSINGLFLKYPNPDGAGFHLKTYAMFKAGSTLVWLLIAASLGIIAYNIGKFRGKDDTQTKLIQNYTFVRNIVELAGLEVGGTSAIKSTNVDSAGGFWSGVQSFFAEKTATVSIPYTAKYGVAMQEKDLQISATDSVVTITMPPTKLLSFELHLDKLEASSKKGLLIFQNDDFYNRFQKQLYSDTRGQLSGNQDFLKRAETRIASILSEYYAPLGLKVNCVFGSPAATQTTVQP